MQNYVSEGKHVTINAAPAANLTPGEGVIVGSIFGVAANNYDTVLDTSYVLAVTGVYTLPKTSALALTIGEKVYWNDAGKVVTATNTDVPIGVAVSAAANPSPTVDVRLSAAF